MASLFLLFIVSFINHFPADAAEPLAFRPHEVTPGIVRGSLDVEPLN